MCSPSPPLLLALVLAGFLAPAPPASAAWTPGGVPLCTATGTQYATSAVPDLAGGAIVVYSDGRVAAQHVASDGTIVPGWGPDGNPVSHSSGQAIAARAAPDGAGGAFVVWQDSRTDVADVYAQHVLGNGVIDPAWPAADLPVAVGPVNQYVPDAAPDGAGGLLVVWQDDRNAHQVSNLDIYAQRVSASGVPLWTANGLAVCVATGDQYLPRVMSDGLGGAYLAWEDTRSGLACVYAQHLGADGGVVPGWPDGGLAIGNPGPIGDEHEPVLCTDGAGGVIVAWTGSNNRVVYHAFALRLTPAGLPAPGWPGAGTQLCSLLQTQDLPQIVTDRAGGAIVVWHDFRDITNPLGTFDLYAQRVNASGATQWTTNGVAVCTAAGSQGPPVAVSDDEGGIIVAWDDPRGADSDIYALRLLPNGARAPGWDADGTALCTFSGSQVNPVIVPDGLSGAIVAWTDSRSTTRFQPPDVYAAKTIDDVVVPVLVSLVDAGAEPGRAWIEWRLPGAGIPARVWRRQAGASWSVVGDVVSSGSGDVAFDDHNVIAGATYDYRLGIEQNGSERFAGEARLTIPGGPVLALEGAQPNPANRGLTIAFSLPDGAPATLALLDVAGRVVMSQPVGTLGGGRHVVRLAGPGAVAAGVYCVRLTRGDRSLMARAAVVR